MFPGSTQNNNDMILVSIMIYKSHGCLQWIEQFSNQDVLLQIVTFDNVPEHNSWNVTPLHVLSRHAWQLIPDLAS